MNNLKRNKFQLRQKYNRRLNPVQSSLAIKKKSARFFSNSRSSRAIETTTVYGISTVTGLSLGLSLGLHLGILIISVFLFPVVNEFFPADTPISELDPGELLPPTGMLVPDNVYIATGSIGLYLQYMQNINLNIIAMLPSLTVPQLQELLGTLSGAVYMHDFAFDLYIHYSMIWEPAAEALFPEIESLFEDWRGVGNNLMETFRSIERILNIPIDDSTLPFQDYED
jgi:hypothetical protein